MTTDSMTALEEWWRIPKPPAARPDDVRLRRPLIRELRVGLKIVRVRQDGRWEPISAQSWRVKAQTYGPDRDHELGWADGTKLPPSATDIEVESYKCAWALRSVRTLYRPWEVYGAEPECGPFCVVGAGDDFVEAMRDADRDDDVEVVPCWYAPSDQKHVWARTDGDLPPLRCRVVSNRDLRKSCTTAWSVVLGEPPWDKPRVPTRRGWARMLVSRGVCADVGDWANDDYKCCINTEWAKRYRARTRFRIARVLYEASLPEVPTTCDEREYDGLRDGAS
jgi:hypothetical protein